jgi:hypothetical protein
MEKIKPINSLVAIRIPYIVRDKLEYGTLKLDYIATTSLEEQHNIITYGIVEALPANLYDVHNHGVEAEMNLEVGDKVYFDKMYSAMHSRMAIKSEQPTYQFLREDENGKILLIPFRAIIMRVSNGELESCNDFVVGEAVKKPKHQFDLEEKYYGDRILVTATPSVCKYKSNLPCPSVRVGEIAVCAQNTVMPIQDRHETRQLFRIRRRQIVGIG